jgi:dTDP-glucose pyrophosphorylase
MTFTNLLISNKTKIKDAFKKISSGGQKCLVVSNKLGILEGTISDGDLRKSIINKKKLNQSILNIYNKDPFYVTKNFNNESIKKIFIKKKYDLIPVVDKKKKILDVLTWEKIFKNKKKIKKLKNIVIIMAGGEGTRLDPFTRVLPKPLIPIKNKTIIEHILDEFKKNGLNNFYVSINYKGSILKSFLEEFKTSNKIKYLEEKKPLGTIGALKLLREKTNEPILIANCDSLVKANYYDLINFHKKNSYDLTIIVSAKEYSIPYGTCVINGNLLEKIIEKPKFNFFTNTGMYIISKELIKLVPSRKIGAIEFINICKQRKKKIGVFPIDDSLWVDIGQWTEFQNNFNKF